MHRVLFLSWDLLVSFTVIIVLKNVTNGGVALTNMLNAAISALTITLSELKEEKVGLLFILQVIMKKLTF